MINLLELPTCLHYFTFFFTLALLNIIITVQVLRLCNPIISQFAMRNFLKLVFFLAFLAIAHAKSINLQQLQQNTLIDIQNPFNPKPKPSLSIYTEEGYWGDWTGFYEIYGYFICGAEMRFQGAQGKGKKNDDTATNGFRWRFCNYPNWHDQQQREFEGIWGDWLGMVMCPTGYYVNGFRARIEGKQFTVDDTAMNGLEIVCIEPNSGDPPRSEIKMVNGGLWGSWSEWHTANLNQLFYAVKMRFQTDQGSGDDTAMNGISFQAKQY